LFKTFDSNGLSWAIDEAMQFFKLPENEKERQIRRIMEQSALCFNHNVTAQRYIDLYVKMLKRPLVNPELCKTK
jgi:starch synthase/alpha-amylase